MKKKPILNKIQDFPLSNVEGFLIETPKGRREIGDGAPCFVVAEMSANHGQSLPKLKKMIKAAAVAGADAIKLQTYTADTLTMDCDKSCFLVGGKDNPKAWQKQNFYQLYQKAYTPWEWHVELKELTESLGLVFFSTPFDPTAVEFLNNLGVPMFKIASYESTDIPLLKKVAATGKPVIMSVGFATLPEIELSVKTLREGGVRDLVLLHCVTSYAENPKLEFTNLQTMLDMRGRLGVMTGFSDNNAGIEIPILAAAMGAAVIEKHFVIEGDKKALDARFSLAKNDFKAMVDAIRRNEKIKGGVLYGPQTEQEKYNRRFRRSLFAGRDVKAGEKFTVENVRDIRPADGLETKYFEQILGRVAAHNIERGTPLSWDLFEGGKKSSQI